MKLNLNALDSFNFEWQMFISIEKMIVMNAFSWDWRVLQLGFICFLLRRVFLFALPFRLCDSALPTLHQSHFSAALAPLVDAKRQQMRCAAVDCQASQCGQPSQLRRQLPRERISLKGQRFQ
mmetsp:Transcript_5572/g.10014  ORF Transcript_5572/g.10014 Transcript_5572/m.10014 type:complete len:122 (+) Transcript_5572:40-405(+)